MTTMPTTADPDARATRAEGIVQIIIMLAIGGAAGAASFTHVHNVADAHGQGGWLAWADAVVLELMSIASGLEMRRRKRQHKPVRFPAAVLGCAVALSIAAQVVEAERSLIGWIAAALPALGFLVMVKIALGRTAPAQPQAQALVPPSPAVDTGKPVDSVLGQNITLMHGNDSASAHRATDPEPSSRTIGRRQQHGSRSASRVRSVEPAEIADVAHLLPAATAARDALIRHGRALTHKSLTEQLRMDGHPLSNARAAKLVKILKAGTNVSEQSDDAQIIRLGREFPTDHEVA
jgi:hypothetical protein